MTAEKGSLEADREALRVRQGLGARHDAGNSPKEELDWARRGTAYFARKLNELHDDELDAPSLVPGWTRRHVIAHVGYHARALCRLAERARTGVELAMHGSAKEKVEELVWGVTLPNAALRHLVAHANVHLNVEWRDLAEADWDKSFRGENGELFTARDTAWLRAKEVWLRAIDLNNGGRLADAPAALRLRLADEAGKPS
jgi:maleylpyruvate isomerase